MNLFWLFHKTFQKLHHASCNSYKKGYSPLAPTVIPKKNLFVSNLADFEGLLHNNNQTTSKIYLEFEITTIIVEHKKAQHLTKITININKALLLLLIDTLINS